MNSSMTCKWTDGVGKWRRGTGVDVISYRLRSVDDSGVVAKLEHSEHSGEDGVRQETC